MRFDYICKHAIYDNLVAVKSYNPLKDVKENAKTLHQRSNPVRGKDQRQSICVKPIFIADLSV